jgi:hypothetical protein
VPAVSAPVVWLPLVDWTPAKLPPDPVQLVALLELQVSSADAPLATAVGAAVKVTVGAGTTVTVCVAGALVPPGPVQVSEYVVLAVNTAVARVPAAGKDPFQPPPAVHAEAFVELQVRVEVAPLAT